MPPITRLSCTFSIIMLTGLTVFQPACKKVEPAPTDIDGLVHWFWSEYDAGTDEMLAEAVVNTHKALDADALEDPLDGTISDLSPEETALVGLESADPAAAQGLFMARPFACTLEKTEELTYRLDQDAIHTDYDAYRRTYTSDLEAYQDREDPFLTWETEYTTSLLGAEYTSHVLGGLRYVPVLDDEQSPHGPALIARTWMPSPAEFEEGSDMSLSQNYQIEVYYEPDPGRIVHLYGQWEEGEFLAGYDMSNEGVQRTVLNGMSDWDDVVEEACQ